MMTRSLFKKMICVAAALFLALSLAACGGGEESGGAPKEKAGDDQGGAPVESEQKKESAEGKDSKNSDAGKIKLSKDGTVVLLESGYSYDKEYGSVCIGAIIADTNSENAYEYSGIEVTAYADDGSILATEEEASATVQPGEKVPVSLNLDTKDKKPKKVEIKAVVGDEIDPDDEAVKTSELVCSNITEHFDKEYGELSYTGEVTNKGASDSEDASVYVILKKKGKIVWAYQDYASVSDLSKGSKKAFDISFYPQAEYDEYEIYAVDETY